MTLYASLFMIERCAYVGLYHKREETRNKYEF